MLDRVEFKNFKALADVTVTLAPLTVIVGANGAGKTSVLEGIDMLGRVAGDVVHAETTHLEPKFTLGGYDLEHYPAIDAEDPEAHVVVRLSSFGVAIKFDEFGEFDVFVGDGSIDDMMEIPPARGGAPASKRSQRTPEEEKVLRQIRGSSLRSSLRLQFDPRRLASPSKNDDDVDLPSITADGSNLASIIAYLLATRSEWLEVIESDLRQVVPQIGRLRVIPTRIKQREQEVLTINGEALTRWVERSHSGYSLQAEIAGRGYVPAHMLSDGTLLTLGILTALHGPKPPRLLLLDDIDRGLHPLAQRKLIECLRRLRAQHPQLQIICTSHSPYFLDALAPEEVRVMKLDADGHAHCKALTEHPEWEQWKDSMTPGEFWSSVGEDWVYGEEPARADEP